MAEEAEAGGGGGGVAEEAQWRRRRSGGGGGGVEVWRWGGAERKEEAEVQGGGSKRRQQGNGGRKLEGELWWEKRCDGGGLRGAEDRGWRRRHGPTRLTCLDRGGAEEQARSAAAAATASLRPKLGESRCGLRAGGRRLEAAPRQQRSSISAQRSGGGHQPAGSSSCGLPAWRAGLGLR